MAQSCNLFYTARDDRQTTLHDESRLCQDRRLARELIRQAHQGGTTDHDRIAHARFNLMIVDLPGEDRRRDFVKSLPSKLETRDWEYFQRGIGNPHLAEVAPNLLETLREIVVHESKLPANLFTQGRSGHTPTMHRLAHPTYALARGYAAEILGTGAILHKRIDGLTIGHSDRLIFGAKAQTGANLTGQGTSLGVIGPDDAGRLVQETFHTSKSRTSESDLRISKPDGREIGVDFKWTGKTERALKKDEIMGALCSLRNGEVHEFHFVTNSRFSNGTRQCVEAINRELSRDTARSHTDLGRTETPILDEHQPGWRGQGAKIVLHEKAPI